jgi:hypothetical protein
MEVSMQSFKLTGLLGLLFAGSLAHPTSADAAFIRTQAPCVNAQGYCRTFTNATPTLPIIRGFSFATPAGSVAQVTFHGSILCAVSPVVPSAKKVVDIVGQIVPISTATANHNGPGGLRYNVALDEFAGSIRGSDTFNLASTRVFANTTAGTKLVYFKLGKLRMDSNTQCWVYNAAFSVIVTP